MSSSVGAILEEKKAKTVEEKTKAWEAFQALFLGQPGGFFVSEVKVVLRFPEDVMIVLKGSKDGRCFIAFSSAQNLTTGVLTLHDALKDGKVSFRDDIYATSTQRAWAQFRFETRPPRP